jgi:hypothetical protein
MVYPPAMRIPAEYRNHIKPGWGVEELSLGQVPLCSPAYLFLLSWVDRCSGRTVTKSGPGFDLDENKNRTIPGDDIYFAQFAAIVFDEYRIAFIFQIPGDDFLTVFS